MHVPHQIILYFRFQPLAFYASLRLMPPFARNDQIRLLVLVKS